MRKIPTLDHLPKSDDFDFTAPTKYFEPVFEMPEYAQEEAAADKSPKEQLEILGRLAALDQRLCILSVFARHADEAARGACYPIVADMTYQRAVNFMEIYIEEERASHRLLQPRPEPVNEAEYRAMLAADKSYCE